MRKWWRKGATPAASSTSIWSPRNGGRLSPGKRSQNPAWRYEQGRWLSLVYWAVQWSWFAWVNALCNLSRKKSREVAASLPGRFLSRRCFTLCITVEAEPRVVKQYKCQYCCSCKNYQRKEMEGGKKVCLRRFLADQKIASSWGKKVFWGILQHE